MRPDPDRLHPLPGQSRLVQLRPLAAITRAVNAIRGADFDALEALRP